MIAVIFEVWPAEGRLDHHINARRYYLNLAAGLKSKLEQIDGLNERDEAPADSRKRHHEGGGSRG